MHVAQLLDTSLHIFNHFILKTHPHDIFWKQILNINFCVRFLLHDINKPYLTFAPMPLNICPIGPPCPIFINAIWSPGIISAHSVSLNKTCKNKISINVNKLLINIINYQSMTINYHSQ